MNRTRRRLLVALGLPASILAAGLVWAGSVAYSYTESRAFCAGQCHSAMLPQSSAHSSSLHAGVACVQCHAAGGLGRKLKTKLAGTSRVVRTALDNYERPIRSDHDDSAHVSAQCSTCHQLEALPSSKPLVLKYFRFDEANTPEQIGLTLKLGPERSSNGSPHGVHNHVLAGMHVEYVATDSQHQNIPWFSVRHRDGSETTYVSDSTKLSKAELRRLPRYAVDCVFCHNRAGHRIATPDDSVDLAMGNGELSPSLPWIKQLAVEVITGSQVSNQAAVRHALFGAYQEQAPNVPLARPEEIEKASTILERVLRKMSFSASNTNWESYPDNLGHRHWRGCFRCHDGQHVTADGKALASDCDQTCHSQPVRGPRALHDPSLDSDWHPWPSPAKTLDILGHRQLACPDCHRAGRMPKRTCDDCHSS